MRRRREEHDAAHRKRHQRGKRAHEQRKERFSVSLAMPFAHDDDDLPDDDWPLGTRGRIALAPSRDLHAGR